jgi:hypothetical protein
MTTRGEALLGYVPHFNVTTVDGRRVRYEEIWQRRNLVLVIVGPHDRDSGAQYASQLKARGEDFEREQATVVVTADAVSGLPAPAVVVADRWGEILYLDTGAGQASRFPDVDELLSWVHFAQIQCPECPP